MSNILDFSDDDKKQIYVAIDILCKVIQKNNSTNLKTFITNKSTNEVISLDVYISEITNENK